MNPYKPIDTPLTLAERIQMSGNSALAARFGLSGDVPVVGPLKSLKLPNGQADPMLKSKIPFNKNQSIYIFESKINFK